MGFPIIPLWEFFLTASANSGNVQESPDIKESWASLTRLLRMVTITRKVDERSRVVLPEGYANQDVSITTLGNGQLKISLARKPRKRPSLASLLECVTDENRHEEIDFGPPVGKEAM